MEFYSQQQFRKCESHEQNGPGNWMPDPLLLFQAYFPGLPKSVDGLQFLLRYGLRQWRIRKRRNLTFAGLDNPAQHVLEHLALCRIAAGCRESAGR